MLGGGGDDTITGNALANSLTGGGGADEIFGLAANDTISVRGDGDGDTANCGEGFDRVLADPGDLFAVAGADACERVN